MTTSTYYEYISSVYYCLSNLLTTARNTSSRLLLVRPQLSLTSSNSLLARLAITYEITMLPILKRKYPLIYLSSMACGNIDSIYFLMASVFVFAYFCWIIVWLINMRAWSYYDIDITEAEWDYGISIDSGSYCRSYSYTKCCWLLNLYIWTLSERKYPLPYNFFKCCWVPTVRKTPLVIIPILLHKASAYYIKWVVKNSALFYRHLLSTSHKCLLFYGSNPVVGSSKNTILGLPTILIPTDSLLFMPPDNWPALKCLNWVKFTSYKAWATIAFYWEAFVPRSLV